MEGMATPVGHPAGPLADALFDEGFDFDFFQAVALLHALQSEAAPVGQAAEPAAEPVRFRSRVGLDFPPGDVQRIDPPVAGGKAATMLVNFMGLAGVHGPLPAVVTEVVMERMQRKDHAFRAFLDLFNHRLLSLQYRVRAEHRPGLAQLPPPDSRLARYLFALIGLGTPRLQGRLGTEDRRLLGHAAVLAGRIRSQSGLESLIADQFGVPATIHPFYGRWLPIPPEEVTVLGRHGRNRELGRTATAGSRMWDQQSLFLIVLGPLSLADFLAFLPVNDRFAPLAAIVRFYAGDEFDFEVELKLRSDDIPQATLSTGNGALLGWTSWLGRNRSDRGASGTIRLSTAVTSAILKPAA